MAACWGCDGRLGAEEGEPKVLEMEVVELDFCNSLLLGAQKRDTVKLQSVQNAAARIVAGLKKRDHITKTLRDLRWLPVEDRIVFKINLITFKALNDSGPVISKIF